MRESTSGTRERIQAVALELFTEQGYEKTSLREIAERLGVTKAALYYHFRSKDEIVTSFVEDRLHRMDELIAWAEQQPAGGTTRRALLARYTDDLFTNEQSSVMRFFEQNQTVLKSLAAGQQMRERILRVADALARGDDNPASHLRATLSLFAVHSSWFAVRAPDLTDDERRRIALEVANELLSKIAEPEAGDPGAGRTDGGMANTAAAHR
ncbi:TetR/AcrR family transcriptional regulator [Micromonospora sp. KC723]|uniref:TetR/AcrR family transcriptional regulator n=1 Tax=Micromonospora sp. KC723 TaxID=2530381 RepID=UPI001053D555|nr:TetR/AcrR family transcriptional regulator [Micromonospora sp. KC723]TDB73276.1 TetR/AcrR family transcriptional regulator [Micromonospora sp. KC723]